MRKRPLFFNVLYLVSFTQYTRALTPENLNQAVAKKLQAHILKSQIYTDLMYKNITVH